MCDDEKFSTDNQIEHFGFHARSVERQTAELHRGIGGVTVESIMQHAAFAYELADAGVPKECKQRLAEIAVEGIVRSPNLVAA